MLSVLTEISSLVLLICLGMYFRKKEIINETTEIFLSNFALDYALPAMLITTLSSIDSQIIKNSFPLVPIITALSYVYMMIFAFIFLRLIPFDRNKKNTLAILLIFNNVANVGYPIMNSLFGEIGVLYATFSNLAFSLLLWTVGIAILTGGNTKQNFKNFMTPGLIAIVIGYSLSAFSIELPYFLEITLIKIGNTMVPLAMFIIGCSLAKQKFVETMKKKEIWIFVLVKQVIMPLLFLLIFSGTVMDKKMLAMETILIAMPSAVNLVAFIRRQKGDYVIASQVVVISTLVSLIVIPIIMWLIN